MITLKNMRTTKRAIFSFLALFVAYHSSVAQIISAQVSSKRVQVGVPFEYSVVFTVNTGNFSPPTFKDFDVVSGPNQSSSYQYVNGVTSQQIVISYGLVAKHEGKLAIGPAGTNYNNQKVETAAITIEAVKGNVNNASNSNDDQQYGNKIGGGDLFIRTGLSKSKCFVGEQITITQKVYCRYQIIGFQKFSQPTYDGFYSQAQESTSKGQLGTENVDGVNYYTFELFRTIATANKAGKIALTPIEGEVVIRKQTNAKPRTIFEQFFGGASYEDTPINTKSKTSIIEVMPLPETGKPESFNGAVGNFNYKVDVTRKELKANEAFNLKISINGKGNIKLIDAPKLPLPESFESYDPKISETTTSKTFDFLVIPRMEGEFSLNNIDFSYFNIDTKKYVTLPSGEIKINVLPADQSSASATVYNSKTQIKETENDIRYIKKGVVALQKSETEFFNSGIHVLLLLLPILLLIVGLISLSSYNKKNSDIIVVKERKALKIARKQLSEAEKLMKQNKKDEFYTEVLTAINNYLSFKLNISVADLSKDNVQSNLKSKQVNDETISKLTNALETSEFAKYAPGAVSGNLEEVYKGIINLVSELEQQLNKKV